MPDVQVSGDGGLPARLSPGRYPLPVLDQWGFGRHMGQCYFVRIMSLAPVPYGIWPWCLIPSKKGDTMAGRVEDWKSHVRDLKEPEPL